jgi:gustatory receptor
MIQVRPKPNDRSRVQEISRNSDETFHNAIAPVLTLAQFFGVMPVCGVSSSKASAHTFKLSSFRSICTVIYIIYSSILAALNFSFFYQIGITPRNTGESHFCQAINLTSFIAVSFVLQLYSTSCFVVFLLIARDWPDLMTFWSKMEQRFLAYPYQEKPFKLNIRATAVVVIVLGFIGYVIFVSTVAYSQMKYAEIQNRTVESPLKHYLLFNYPYIFVNVPYSLPLGLFIEISTIPLIFIWNYMELFVMMICIGLVARFHQINERLDGIRGKVRHFNILTWIC